MPHPRSCENEPEQILQARHKSVKPQRQVNLLLSASYGLYDIFVYSEDDTTTQLFLIVRNTLPGEKW